jgi:hypothetical protein
VDNTAALLGRVNELFAPFTPVFMGEYPDMLKIDIVGDGYRVMGFGSWLTRDYVNDWR